MRFLLLGSPAVRVPCTSGGTWHTRTLGPKSTAVLALLVQAPRGATVRRESLVRLLWPGSPDRQARAALRQILTGLRSSVGPEVIHTEGKQSVGVSPDAAWCDTWAFEDHLRREEFQEALDLYRGDFLEGLRVDGGAELEQWMDARQRWYVEAACDAAWARTRELCATGELRAAVAAARFAVRQKPLHEPGVRQFLRLLASAGDAAGAVRTYRSFRQQMDEELGLSPSEETEAVIHAIRTGEAGPCPSTLFQDPGRRGSAGASRG